MHLNKSVTQIPQLSATDMSISLNGVWATQRWPFTGTDEAGLTLPELDTSCWEKVHQPGKVFYGDPESERNPPPDWNRVTLAHIDPEDGAVLRRTITVPAAWAGKRIMLRFDSVYPAGRFYMNGTLLGEHLSGLTPVEFDVTGMVCPGDEATIAVRLIRRHKFVQMDMVRHAIEFSGLAQSACLFAVEQCHITEYHFINELESNLASATVRGTINLQNENTLDVDVKLTVRITDPAGKCITEKQIHTHLNAGSKTSVPVALDICQPELWNDEFPNLYEIAILLDASGQCSGKVDYRTGFRHLELSPDGPKLNGSFVKFRGVNHLTFHPEYGMYTPELWLRENLTLMKRANINAIRTHFLGPRALADLCDELGMYLLQELPIDWGTDYIHDPDWVEPALLRIESGVRRDRHHPSVMVWSVGNENMPKNKDVAKAGWAHLRQYERLVKELDPSRPTMFPPPGPANAIQGIIELRVGDIADTHYSFHHIRNFLERGEVENPDSWDANMVTHTREWALERGWSGVWFSSEYGIFNGMPDLLYSPGCSIITDVPEDPLSGKNTLQAFEERLRREWGYMRDERTCLGGAYFPWLCCGAGSREAGNPWGWVRWGEDADWGVVTADLLPKPFFWAMRVLFSPVWFPDRVQWTPGENDMTFTVHNQYNAIDLKDCILRVQQTCGGSYMTMMRHFKDVPIACAPGEKAEIRIPLEAQTLKALENGRFVLCRCSLLDPKGFRPVTADIYVEPTAVAGELDETMTIGPDAVSV